MRIAFEVSSNKATHDGNNSTYECKVLQGNLKVTELTKTVTRFCYLPVRAAQLDPPAETCFISGKLVNSEAIVGTASLKQNR